MVTIEKELDIKIARKKIKDRSSLAKKGVFPFKECSYSATDGPETSRRDIIAQHVRFVERAGGKVIGARSGATDLNFEISPLVSYSGEGLKVSKERHSTRRTSIA
ncbi:UDP-N-acetylglucosamine pyrophosphorylase [Massospora cicadina]|nr:UDP-N-acetylglucosamine pyrophosphorylase [Massospora cicadina]